MRLRRFTASKVHGSLNFDVNFLDDLTFLIGINGSGKTTVVNGAFSLIAPSLPMLAEIDFESMEVEVENERQVMRIWSTKDDKTLRLFTSLTDVALEISVIPKNSFPFRSRSDTLKYYREEEMRNSAHPVLELLKKLPTPMLLNIDRRFEGFLEERLPRMRTRVLERQRAQNIFSSSLANSLMEAVWLAEDRFRTIQGRQIELRDNLRKKFLFTTIQYDITQTAAKLPKLLPADLERRQEQITSILSSLGLEETEVEGQLKPFFERLKYISQALPIEFDPTKFPNRDKKGRPPSAEIVGAYLEWTVLRPQFDRIESISHHVDDYLKASTRLNFQIDGYLDMVNQFLRDSGKEIEFSRKGDLRVKFGQSESRQVTSVSSGESQIIVILTHLTFNPDAHRANVFIVDEPELSLHVRWQELFVKAIRSAAPQLQVILATHSPSIILDDIEHCVDLSAKGLVQ